jgi:hypothetical protein
MHELFSRLTLADIHRDVIRNIVSLRESQDLFDDLTQEPAEWALAQQVEAAVKPLTHRSPVPVIHRPFEDAAWFNAIDWPFKHWQASRFSAGTYGVWYGSASLEATVHESVYHWYHGLLADAKFESLPVIGERKVYTVACDAALLDLRPVAHDFPGLLHKTDYSFPQAVGARIHREGHPGLVVQSVRCPSGENYAVFNPGVLSNPRLKCQLTYRVAGSTVVVEKRPLVTWLEIPVEQL